MRNIPYKGTALNIGVENGSEYVLSESFLKENDPKVDKFHFSNPEDLNGKDYYQVIAEESAMFAEMIKSTLANDEIPIVIGGDHSVSFASTLAVLHKYKHVNVGVIQIDSHADLHLTTTSPSGNFHGMYLRPFFDKFDDKNINQMTSGFQLPASNLLYIGNLETETEEDKFIKENNIQVLSGKMWDKDLISTIMLLKSFVHNMDHIHISFDIDVLNASLVSATGTPAANGLELNLVIDILNIIKKNATSYSFDLVEVNPAKPESERTIAVAQQILNTIV